MPMMCSQRTEQTKLGDRVLDPNGVVTVLTERERSHLVSYGATPVMPV